MPPIPVPRWMTAVLLFAGVYNLAWGAAAVLFPETSYRYGGLWSPETPLVNAPLWQCIGMIVGVYGVGYLLAARDPVGRWPLVFVGLLGKVLGPIGMAFAAARGQLPWSGLVTSLFNDAIWWLPFGLILGRAWAAYRDDEASPAADRPETALTQFRTQHGETLAELSRQSPVLLVFLRHLGCTFCREALADVAARRDEIERNGTRIALVHLATDDQAMALFAKHHLENVARVADPEQRLFRAFALKRSSLSQLFSVPTLKRFAQALAAGHVNGLLVGDGFRLGGAFLVRDCKAIKEVRLTTVADRPDYCEIARAT